MQDELSRLLSGIPRETAPDVPVETLLRRAAETRRPLIGLAAVGILVLAGLTIGLKGEPREAPVHLHLRVVEIEQLPDDASLPAPAQPEEFDRP